VTVGFSERLLRWWRVHGRHDLPWQSDPRDRYRIWVAEVMLQQTQVVTVLDYYRRFMQRFPDVAALAAATEDDVLAAWSGLGYYSRARNLHASAQRIGAVGWPADLDGWMALPGIGRSTASAVLAQATGARHAILDGNVKRVLARHAGIEGWPGRSAVLRELWAEAEARTPQDQVADYTQAIMDLGATLCTARAPRCADCPLAGDCVARASDRQSELPQPRPRRALPERETHWLVARRGDGSVMLTRRPPAGIWGGLWAPPEAPDLDGLDALVRRAGAKVSERVGPLRHAFTHFRLTIHPHLAALTETETETDIDTDWAEAIADAESIWYRPGGGQIVGLPKPVSVLLEQLSST
jgi:A/G-specific adenine glycosylase